MNAGKIRIQSIGFLMHVPGEIEKYDDNVPARLSLMQ